jgi:hypothetical protein
MFCERCVLLYCHLGTIISNGEGKFCDRLPLCRSIFVQFDWITSWRFISQNHPTCESVWTILAESSNRIKLPEFADNGTFKSTG